MTLSLKSKSLKEAAYKIDKTSVIYGLYYWMAPTSLPAIFQNSARSHNLAIDSDLLIKVAAFNSTTLGKLFATTEEKDAFKAFLNNSYGKARSQSTWNYLLKLPVSHLVCYLVGEMDEDDLEDAVEDADDAVEDVEAFFKSFLDMIYKDPSVFKIGLENLPANLNNLLVDVLTLNFEVEPSLIQGTLHNFAKIYGGAINRHRNVKGKKGKKVHIDDEEDDLPSAKPIEVTAEEIKPMGYEELFDTALSAVESKILKKISPRGSTRPNELDKVELNLTFYLSRFKDSEKRENARCLIFQLARLTS